MTVSTHNRQVMAGNSIHGLQRLAQRAARANGVRFLGHDV
jgi:hypothetical protein